MRRSSSNWRAPARAAAALLTALVLAGAPAAQEAEPTREPPPPIAVGPDAVPDAAIAERIDGILGAIPAFDGVSAEVRSGVVTLRGSVAEAADTDRLKRLTGRLEGVLTVESQIEATRDVGERLVPAFSRVAARFRQALTAIPLILLGLVALAAIAGLGAVLTRSWAFYGRIAPNAFIADIYRHVVLIAFVFAGLATALDLLGATALLGTVLGAAGILGLAVGFGVRDTIENFVASVMLSLRQPFAPNDLVEIEGELGHVIRLTSRATVLLSQDGNHVRLPNAVVFKSKIVNFTREPQRRFVFDLGIDPDSDLAAARDTGLTAIRGLDFALDDPPAKAWIEDVGDSNVIVRFTGWIDQTRTDFHQARGEAIRVTKTALESAGFALPEPIYRLRIDPRRAAGAGGEAPEHPTEPTALPGIAAASAAAQAPKDATIERKVEADRRAAPAADLLRPGGARE